jgi:hypothetical protein
LVIPVKRAEETPLAGHAQVNAVEAWTATGTSVRAMRYAPHFVPETVPRALETAVKAPAPR